MDQVKKLSDQGKFQETAVFSLDQQKWFAASKNLPKLFVKYAAELAPLELMAEPEESAESASAPKPKKKSASKKVGTKGAAKSNSVTSAPKKTVRSVSSRPGQKSKKSGGGLTSFILLLLVLGLAGGGAFFHRKVSDEILVNADKALSAFCKSLQLDASYELNVALTLDKVILKNVHFKNEEKHLNLHAKEVECTLAVLQTMGWFLTDEVSIEQPQPLWSKISGFQGVFIENGHVYKAEQIVLDFFGSFLKKDSVIEGEVAKGKVLLTVSQEVLAKVQKAEIDRGAKLPREGEALSIQFSGPFDDVTIQESSDLWRGIADVSFR